MIGRRVLLTAILALAPGLALASGGGDGADKKDVGQYVDLLPVGLPIVADGRLVNYIFVYVRLNLTSTANASRLREQEPYFRDALVRAGHRTPFTLASDYGRIDSARLSSVLQQEAAAIVGRGQIKSVEVTRQAPRRRVATPRS